MSAAHPVYLELVDFIAGGTTPESVANFHPSAQAERRFAELVALEREQGLSADERFELDHFVELEHILRMAKARARQLIAARGQ